MGFGSFFFFFFFGFGVVCLIFGWFLGCFLNDLFMVFTVALILDRFDDFQMVLEWFRNGLLMVF